MFCCIYTLLNVFDKVIAKLFYTLSSFIYTLWNNSEKFKVWKFKIKKLMIFLQTSLIFIKKIISSNVPRMKLCVQGSTKKMWVYLSAREEYYKECVSVLL